MGTYSFYLTKNLKAVTIPEGVTKIDSGAFFQAISLTKITLPDSVKTIGRSAFEQTTKIEHLAIPENVKTFPLHMLMYCLKLETLVIPGGVKMEEESDYGYLLLPLFEENGNAPTVTIYGEKGSEAEKLHQATLEKRSKDFGEGELQSRFLFKHLPAKPSSVKVKAGTKKMTVSWKKGESVKGYQITYATNKSFTKDVKKVHVAKAGTTKKTVSKLKSGKTYYVKVRSYITENGTKIYGSYSVVKKIKAK